MLLGSFFSVYLVKTLTSTFDYLILRIIDMTNENDIYFLEKILFIYKFYFSSSYYGHGGFDPPIAS